MELFIPLIRVTRVVFDTKILNEVNVKKILDLSLKYSLYPEYFNFIYFVTQGMRSYYYCSQKNYFTPQNDIAS